jgi:hypothetical protein
MPVLTKLQEDIKFTALENYFIHFKTIFRPSLEGDMIDDSGDDLNTFRIERKQA